MYFYIIFQFTATKE